MSDALELAVLVSGNGSNLEAICSAIDAGRLAAHVRLVLANRPEAFALERARRRGLRTAVLSHGAFPSRSAFDAALRDAIDDAVPASERRYVVLAGFMRILTETFLDAFPMRVVNLHPSLLPAFRGADAIGAALAAGVTVTGCTVHLVDHGVDTGPILAQSPVEILPTDTRDSLAERLHAREHQLLPQVLQAIAQGQLATEGGRPRLLQRVPSAGLR